MSITIQQINDELYKAFKKTKMAKHTPDMPLGLTQGDQSKWLIHYAEKHQRSVFTKDWLTQFFTSLYFSSEPIEVIVIFHITNMMKRLYHLDFTSLSDLYKWAATAKTRSFYKDVTVQLLSKIKL